jgi:hypothetical protein
VTDLHHPSNIQGWEFRVSNLDATRPPTPASVVGVTITPGNNTKGAWAEVLAPASITESTYLMLIEFCGGSTSGASRDIIADVGVDPAGGTTYSVLCPDLLCSACGSYPSGFGPTRYRFSVRVTAGSSVAVRGSVNNATVGTFRASIALFGRPRDPSSIRYGTYVRAYGITAASSSGTAIAGGDIGGAADGTMTELGTVAAGDRVWEWQLGVGINNAALTANNYFADLAVKTTTNYVVRDALLVNSASEQVQLQNPADTLRFLAVAGDKIYGRLQCSGTPDTGFSMAGYGVGGGL